MPLPYPSVSTRYCMVDTTKPEVAKQSIAPNVNEDISLEQESLRAATARRETDAVPGVGSHGLQQVACCVSTLEQQLH
jgi:hypothetical protein